MYGFYKFFFNQIILSSCSLLSENSEISFFMSLMKIVYILIVFLIILGGSYYLSKFLARKNFGRRKIMRIVETLSLGYDRNIYIISIGKDYFLISSAQKNINFLYKLSEEDIKSAIIANKNDTGSKFKNTQSDRISEYYFKEQEKERESIIHSIIKVIKNRGKND